MKKKLEYMEVAEAMTSAGMDMMKRFEVAMEVIMRINELGEPKNVREEAIRDVMMQAMPTILSAMEAVARVTELFSKSMYVTGRKSHGKGN